MKIKEGQIVQNKRTKSIYVVLPDKGSRESTTQIRLSELTKDFKIYKPIKITKKMKEYYDKLKDNITK